MSAETLGRKYWNRRGNIQIEGYGDVLSGLDFKFEIKKVGSLYSRFKLSILGLTSDTINELTVWNPVDASSIAREVIISAGYEGDKITSPICRGFIYNAIPTPPPEMWLNMDCMISLKGGVPISAPRMFCDTEAKSILDYMSTQCDFNWNWKSVNMSVDKKINFNVDGNRNDIVQKFADSFGLIAVMDDEGDITFYDEKPWANNVPTENDRHSIPNINMDNGLLAIGGVDMKGATIRVRLDDSYRTFEWVYLESKLIPKASGFYFVLEKRHVGHFRGDEWYTELSLRRRY